MQPNRLVQSVSEVSLFYAAGWPGMPAWAAAETLLRRLGKTISNTDVDSCLGWFMRRGIWPRRRIPPPSIAVDSQTWRTWRQIDREEREEGFEGDEEKWGSRTKSLRLSRTPSSSPFHKGLDSASRNAVLIVESRQEEQSICWNTYLKEERIFCHFLKQYSAH